MSGFRWLLSTILRLFLPGVMRIEGRWIASRINVEWRVFDGLNSPLGMSERQDVT